MFLYMMVEMLVVEMGKYEMLQIIKIKIFEK